MKKAKKRVNKNTVTIEVFFYSGVACVKSKPKGLRVQFIKYYYR